MAADGARAGRVWVTGLGLVTALGNDAESTWRRLLAGERGLSTLDLFDASAHRASLVAEVRGVAIPPPSNGLPFSRASAFAARAGGEALRHAGIDLATARVGLVVGGTTGGMLENELDIAAMYPDAADVDAREDLRSHPLSSVADAMGNALGSFARVRTVASACSSGATAIALGAGWLLAGWVDAVLVGGSDALCRLTLTGFGALGVMDAEPCRPFDRSRRGLNLGEGAGFLLLERAADAERRGARALAELAGWALGSEAHHVTNPDPSGVTAAEVIARALAHAGVAPSALDYVNAHGTGTPLNDKTEALALRSVLGAEAERVRVSSSKAQIGHTLGAAGAIEAVFSALAIRDGVMPPTVGLVDPDPDCALAHVVETTRARVRTVLSNAFGFGGMDSALVLTAPGATVPRRTRPRAVVVSGAAILRPDGVLRGEGCKRALEGPPAEGKIDPGLDPAKSRRIDGPSRLATAAMMRALEEVSARGPEAPRAALGVCVGNAFGSVHGSADFTHKLVEKGPRLAPPADFPNLVPSAPAGHGSIYLGLRGPALATADLAASGISAIFSAYELVAMGDAEGACGASYAERTPIVDRVFAPLFGLDAPAGSRLVEAAAAVVLEAEEACRARGTRVMARVADARIVGGPADLPDLGVDAASAVVVLPHDEREVEPLIAGSAWAHVRRVPARRGSGHSETLDAIATSAAAALVASGSAKRALVLAPREVGPRARWAYALLLEVP